MAYIRAIKETEPKHYTDVYNVRLRMEYIWKFHLDTSSFGTFYTYGDGWKSVKELIKWLNNQLRQYKNTHLSKTKNKDVDYLENVLLPKVKKWNKDLMVLIED